MEDKTPAMKSNDACLQWIIISDSCPMDSSIIPADLDILNKQKPEKQQSRKRPELSPSFNRLSKSILVKFKHLANHQSAASVIGNMAQLIGTQVRGCSFSKVIISDPAMESDTTQVVCCPVDTLKRLR